jgi:hypothetical protein
MSEKQKQNSIEKIETQIEGLYTGVIDYGSGSNNFILKYLNYRLETLLS